MVFLTAYFVHEWLWIYYQLNSIIFSPNRCFTADTSNRSCNQNNWQKVFTIILTVKNWERRINWKININSFNRYQNKQASSSSGAVLGRKNHIEKLGGSNFHFFGSSWNAWCRDKMSVLLIMNWLRLCGDVLVKRGWRQSARLRHQHLHFLHFGLSTVSGEIALTMIYWKYTVSDWQ